MTEKQLLEKMASQQTCEECGKLVIELQENGFCFECDDGDLKTFRAEQRAIDGD